MFALLIRRILWIAPTLFVVSIAAFWFLCLVPDVTEVEGFEARVGADESARMRRERFVDLPVFFNTAPRDVRVLSREAVRAIAEGDPQTRARGEKTLVRLGATALPHVFGIFDEFDPRTRGRVALVMTPIAARMGIDVGQISTPEAALAFWTRFWTERQADFQRARVRTNVERLARYGTRSRALELRELDTFALEALFAMLEVPEKPSDVAGASILVEAIAHVSERSDRFDEDAELEVAVSAVRRWKAWWQIYRLDYASADGTGRVWTFASETRFAKWVLRVVLGLSGDVELAQNLRGLPSAVPTTLRLVFGGTFLAYAIGLVLGVLSARATRSEATFAIGGGVLLAYALPSSVLAAWLAVSAEAPGATLLGIVVVAFALVAGPTRHGHAALKPALVAPHLDAVRARGAGEVRVVVLHALRPALMPTVTLFAMEPPIAVSVAFIAEHVLGLDGLGALTLHAIFERDIGFIMTTCLLFAAVATLSMLLSDLAFAALDPRLRSRFLRGSR